MNQIVVIDYGMGNLHSAAKAVEKVAVRHKVLISNDPRQVAASERIVFPGQGAMPSCMAALKNVDGLLDAVLDAAKNKPFLGICVGLQMLFEHSEEGDVSGLGLLPGKIKRFPENAVDANGRALKVPHMGWNECWQKNAHPLWQGIADGERFYFVHSYYASADESVMISGETNYALSFAAAAAKDNIFAVQFHPEKSAQAGLRLLNNFLNWQP